MYGTIPDVPPDPGLTGGFTADLIAVEQAFPGWNVWLSDEGRIYATHILTASEMTAIQRQYSLSAGSGVTLDAATPAEIRGKIGRHVEEYRAWAA